MASFPSIRLIYGNQAYAVDEAAAAQTDRVLGDDAPRDFAFHRFDAVEILKAGSADAVGEAIAAFQVACETAPFLCERWVVRLDHCEAVKGSDKAARNIEKALAEMRGCLIRFEGNRVWALEEDLSAKDEREGPPAPQRWVSGVEARTGAPPLLHLAPEAVPDAGAEAGPESGPENGGAQFLIGSGKTRKIAGLRGFLAHALKGKFAIAGDETDAAPDAPPSSAMAPRLHRLLERLAERPPEGMHLILTAAAGRESDLSRALVSAIKKSGEISKFVTYDDHEPVEWVLTEARKRELAMTRPQALLLIHLGGNDMGRLAGELDKLALLFPGKAPILEETLAQSVGGGASTSLFLITEKLGAKDLSGALGVLENFLANTPGEHPLLIGILARYTRQLMLLHTLRREGVHESAWASRLKLHPFIAKKLTVQAWRFSPRELKGMLTTLAELDLALKFHSHLTGPLLRDFVQDVCKGHMGGTNEMGEGGGLAAQLEALRKAGDGAG